eukprot:CAMPEP_0171843110 /NCGR_PEP_ID=MMETSP0992-20121227/15638_1 /TAXON_ID=483369 /ORGANISM="non described non described, Strain CCMP2098" /LENGTH=201 /DNA_ID=CAMNT_0012460571 /DNA_START=242 /DNA_END=847 /DNA_ORIENTATION=+
MERCTLNRFYFQRNRLHDTWGGVVAWLDAYFSLSLSLSFDFTFLCTPSLLPPLSFVVVAPPSLSVQVGVGNPLRRKVATKGGEAAGEGSGADSDSSKDSSGGTKSPYAGSEGELVDGVGDDDEVEGVVGRGRGGGGGPRSADEVDELAALDAEVNAELGLGLDDDLDDDDDGDDDDGDDDDLDAELEAEIAAELGEDSDEE